jgi:hypothetical protein
MAGYSGLDGRRRVGATALSSARGGSGGGNFTISPQELKRWIDSLSIDELQDALHFSFEIDDNDRSNSIASFDGTACNHSSSSSHELDLLQQMVDLQCPSPTPIHPR